ncbi:MAG: hypothetical protein MUC87_09115 [Bacteroidia bacterium]|jgi:hypothetical protein|nr:hypothetical protein [Bacteroidia bacterium]
MPNSVHTLIFVYNADAKITSAAFDFLHKIISPSTYPCKLCEITYGTFSMVKEWKDFIATLPLPVKFLHRDEWQQLTGRSSDTLPAAFLQQGNEYSLWIEAERMNAFELEDLMRFVSENITSISGQGK